VAEQLAAERSRQPALPDLVALVEQAGSESAAAIAGLTRAAYARSDPLPGLPVPDGACDSTATILRGFACGVAVWTARSAAGELLGALRCHPDGDAWVIGRVAVAPAHCGTGVARTLLRTVEIEATKAGKRWLRLDAVVERCLPTFYWRLGFRPLRHWASGDKPLTEVTLARRIGSAEGPVGLPWLPPASPTETPQVLWLISPEALTAVVTASDGPSRSDGPLPRSLVAGPEPSARLAGFDVWRGGSRPPTVDRLCQLLARNGARSWRTVTAVHFPADRAAVPAHVLPRGLHSDLYAWARFQPGKEPLLWQIRNAAAHPSIPSPITGVAYD